MKMSTSQSGLKVIVSGTAAADELRRERGSVCVRQDGRDHRGRDAH